MADTPEILTREQIIGLMVDAYLSRSQTVNDLRPGSVLLSLLEAFGEAGFKLSSDMITMLDSIAIDRATGDALKRLANDKRVPIYSATPSTGNVDIFDQSFIKIQDKIYAGRPAPVAGSGFIFISDAGKFPATGSLFIGRGTPSIEGPLSYGTSVRNDPDTNLPVQGVIPKAGGAYYMVVLDNTNETVKFHNIGETVIVGQGGDRTIPAGSIVQTSQSTSAEAVSFTTTSSAKILDGETLIQGVPVIAQEAGSKTNVARGAIREILGTSFDAACFNPLPFSNARDDDTDEILRERIKQYEQAKARGTETAIIRYSIDALSPDDKKRVSSAKVKRTAGTEQILFFDDGTGYEPIDAGVGFETLIDQALGGEREFQISNSMIERATVKTVVEAPFDVRPGDTLTVEIIGEGQFSHTFQEGDFRIFRQADAFELASSINSNFNLPFVSRTVDGGRRISITPKNAQNIQVVGGSANQGLKFPTSPIFTLRVYRNDFPTSFEGKPAFVDSLPQDQWSNILNGHVIQYIVDNSVAINSVITDTDFQKYGPVFMMNQSTPIDIWARVLNDKMPGVTVTVIDSKLRFTSNIGRDPRAAIKFSTINAIEINSIPVQNFGASMFGTNTVVEAQGLGADYRVNLKTGQMEWNDPLQPGESATIGSEFSKAKFQTANLPTGLSLGSNNGYLWMTVDGSAGLVPHSITGSSLNIVPSGDITILTANTGAFNNVAVGDYLISWRNSGESFINNNNTGIFRVYDVVSDSEIHINAAGMTLQNGVGLAAPSRFTFVRSKTPVQVVELDPILITTPVALRDAFNNQIVGINSTTLGTIVRIESKSADENESQIVVAVFTDNLSSLGFSTGTYESVPSHNGFTASNPQKGYGMPTFKLLSRNNVAANSVIPDDSTYLRNGGTENDIISYLDWNDGVSTNVLGELTTYTFKGPNKGVFEQVSKYDSANGWIETIRKGLSFAPGYLPSENFTLYQGLSFDAQDRLSFIIDQDEVVKSYVAQISRRVRVLPGATPLQFDLADAESDLDFNDPATFRDFDFSNFKFWIRPKLSTQGLNFKYKDFGPAGSKVGISFNWPTTAESELTHVVSEGPITDIGFTLTSGPAEQNDSDATTSWTVENVETAGNTDFVTYTYRIGTNPNLSVTPGSIVHISPASSLRQINTGTFKVTENPLYPPTASSFTIERDVQPINLDDSPVNTSIVYPSNTVPFSSGGRMTITSNGHGLTTGDVVGVYNVDIPEYNGTYTIITSTVNTFTVQIAPELVFGGAGQQVRRLELSLAPNWAASVMYNINTVVNRNGNTYIALTTAPDDTLPPDTNPTEWQFISHVTINSWDVMTVYTAGQKVEFSGDYYQALVNTLAGDSPITAPAKWNQIFPVITADYIVFLKTATDHNLDELDLVKISNLPNFSLSSFDTTTNIFTVPDTDQLVYLQQIGVTGQGIGSSFVSTGRADQQPSAFGNLAKGLKIDTSLSFYGVVSNQQEIKDYTDEYLSEYMEVELSSPTDLIDSISPLYTDSALSITIEPYFGSNARTIIFPSPVPFLKGAVINLQLPVNANPLRLDIHDKDLQVIEVNGNEISVITDRLASPGEAPLTIGGTSYTAKQSVYGFGKGDSHMRSGDLSEFPASPAFELKQPISDLEAEDEAFLICTTAEQLSRLLNRLANSGLSNVAEVGTATIDSSVQVRSNTFGSDGGAQMPGGRANTHGAAVFGAGQQRGGLGGVDIQSDLRIGFPSGSFVELINTVPQVKQIQNNGSTQIEITDTNTLTITAGSGTFQTERSSDYIGRDIKIERHGDYMCYQLVGGAAVNLESNGVKIGDWVRINETGLSFKILSTNKGIFKIVAIYGDSFWIENEFGTEQFVTDLIADAIKIYSHDSVMPGDKVDISTNILGPNNAGTYTVAGWDDVDNVPSSTTLKINETLENQSATALGSEFVKFNIIEKDPLKLLKQVYAAVPSLTGTQFSFLVFTDSELLDRISTAFGAGVIAKGKLGMDESVKLGLDAYRFYEGLIAELYKIIYGDPSDPFYDGVRAAGTNIDIQAALIRRVKVTINLRIKTGIPTSEIMDAVRSAAAGYINGLDVGQNVSLSEMISVVQGVDGVISVTVPTTSPIQDNGIIKTLPEETAKVVNIESDVTVNIVSG